MLRLKERNSTLKTSSVLALSVALLLTSLLYESIVKGCQQLSNLITQHLSVPSAM